ncbi:MAG: DUF6776 family protein [Pseudohongiella sp.]|uniref:DUF6776 family protein n=1 Tax=Pseudohongiella sp. TaxID=1979412 RepID=UPI0034A07C3A
MTVVPHRPWQRAAVWLSGLLLIVILVLMAYRTGFDRGAGTLAELNLAHSQGLSDVQRSSRQLAELRAALSVAERNQEVDEQANAQAQASIAALRNKVASLERDVALYRQVMALDLDAADAALTLQSWQLLDTELPDHYRYRLVLAYTGANGAELTGKLSIAVTGVSELGDLQGPEGMVEQTVRLVEPVSIRYLQVLEGDVVIPSGFVAKHVKLDFNAGSSSTVMFSERMPWQPEGDN